jgi:hypothetical protein
MTALKKAPILGRQKLFQTPTGGAVVRTWWPILGGRRKPAAVFRGEGVLDPMSVRA